MKILLCLLTIGVVPVAGAQHYDQAGMLKNATDGITALSAQQVAQLLAADGMGVRRPR